MRRLTISNKIFLSFLTLFAFGAFMAFLLSVGFEGLRRSSSDIKTLKEFQLAVRNLESVAWHAAEPTGVDQKRLFFQHFSELKEQSEALAHLHSVLPDAVRLEFAGIDQKVGYFKTAFLELMERREADERIHETQHRLMEELSRRLAKTESVPLRANFTAMLTHWGRAYHDRDAASIARLKTIFRDLNAHRLDPDDQALLSRIDLALEENFLNYLALKDAEDLLRESGKRFVQVSDQAVGLILSLEEERKDSLIRVIAIIVTLSLLLTFGLWVLWSRSARRFLSDSNDIIRAFGQGRYHLPKPLQPDDEFGDLIRFILQLGESLDSGLTRLRDSEEKYRSLVENISDWVWETNPDGVCVYSNPVIERILGVPVAQAVGTSLEKILCDEGEASSTCREALASRAPSSGNVVSYRLRADGSTAVLESSWIPIQDEEGQFLGLRGVSRDVTDRHHAEEEKRRLQAQLLHAQKLEAIGTLSGGVAHDFNNLLQSIGGYADLLLERGGLKENDRAVVGKILQTTTLAGKLTQQLLLYSRRAETRFVPVDLATEVAHARDMLERTISKRIRIVTDCAPDTPPVLADPTQLEQVLINLILNARDAIAEEGTITVSTRRVVSQSLPGDDVSLGLCARLTVADTGVGIPDSLRERIFEPFFTTKDVGKGTGLGLSIVYGIAKTHHASLRCESAMGKGSAFILDFPAVRREDLSPDKEPMRETKPATTHVTKTILVIDDEPAIRDSCRELLTLNGFRTLTAASGEEGLAAFREANGEVDLVLLDLNMPGMGGLECCQRILEADPQAKIIIATGYSEDEYKTPFLREKSVGFLKKPYRLQNLLGIIRERLSVQTPIDDA